MNVTLEDAILEGYKYSWPPKGGNDMTLADFLNKYKPSMVQNDGTKPWIWVKGKDAPYTGSDELTSEITALEEGSLVVKKLEKDVENIKNDASIPVRSNKKTGAKSKKEVREERQAEATENLKTISIKHHYVHGKWLIFVSADKVDTVWKGIANGLVSGELSYTPAFSAKVATSPANENPNYQHLICVYFPNVYDKEVVTEIMKVLLKHHGVSLSGVKSDLYTALGIDSKHPTGLQSTIWKNASIMNDAEMRALKDEFFKSKTAASGPSAPYATVKAEDGNESGPLPGAVRTEEQDLKPPPPTKSKPKLKRKKEDEDPFASDEDTKPALKKAPLTKRVKAEETEE